MEKCSNLKLKEERQQFQFLKHLSEVLVQKHKKKDIQELLLLFQRKKKQEKAMNINMLLRDQEETSQIIIFNFQAYWQENM